jgi:hypothetical protein
MMSLTRSRNFPCSKQPCRSSLGIDFPKGAAKRMTEATGFEAKTIHRLLEVDPKGGGFKRGDDQHAADADAVSFPRSGPAKCWPMSSHPARCQWCVSPKYSGRRPKARSS